MTLLALLFAAAAAVVAWSLRAEKRTRCDCLDCRSGRSA